MKTKKFSKKLDLNKNTISNLNSLEQSKVKGGYISASCPDYPFNCATNEHNCTTGCPSINPRYCF
jgi:hypothetical protein